MGFQFHFIFLFFVSFLFRYMRYSKHLRIILIDVVCVSECCHRGREPQRLGIVSGTPLQLCWTVSRGVCSRISVRSVCMCQLQLFDAELKSRLCLQRLSPISRVIGT